MKTTIAALALALLALAGCQKKQSPSEPAIARVNQAVLVQQDINDLLPDGMSSIPQAQREEFVRRWIDTELFYQEAVKMGLDKDPKVSKQIKDLQKEILANQFIQKQMVDKGRVDEDESRRYFETHQDQYQSEVRLSQILTATPEQAQLVMAALSGGEDFAKLAREKSLDPTTSGRGGDLAAYLRRGSGQVPVDFEEKIFSLKKGEFSQPIRMSDGYHIMKVTDIRPSPQKVKFEDVRDDLIYGLTMVRQRDRFETISDSLRQSAKVESHPELIK